MCAPGADVAHTLRVMLLHQQGPRGVEMPVSTESFLPVVPSSGKSPQENAGCGFLVTSLKYEAF